MSDSYGDTARESAHTVYSEWDSLASCDTFNVLVKNLDLNVYPMNMILENETQR